MKPVSLREHFEALLKEQDLRYQQRFDAQNKAIDAALASAEKAVTKAEGANEKRFEAVNEFRASLSDMVNTLLPRPEADARFKAMQEKLDAIGQRMDKSEGAGGGRSALWVLLSGVALLVVSIAGFALPYLKG